MTADLRAQLQSTLGHGYTVEREIATAACRACSWRVRTRWGVRWWLKVLAPELSAWYAWRFRFSHELARGRLDEAAIALRTALKDPSTDKYAVLARFAPLWANPATREMATDSLIARGPAFAAVPLARYMRSDSVVIAVMERAARDPEQIEVRFAWGMYAYLGPRLRGDARLQPVFRLLGYPEVGGTGSVR